ncbi:MAG TPA: hypothetical protein VF304_14380 [Casimicrobiaceae bacterium]
MFSMQDRTSKYAKRYSGERCYGGGEHDRLERLAIATTLCARFPVYGATQMSASRRRTAKAA